MYLYGQDSNPEFSETVKTRVEESHEITGTLFRVGTVELLFLVYFSPRVDYRLWFGVYPLTPVEWNRSGRNRWSTTQWFSTRLDFGCCLGESSRVRFNDLVS